MTEGNPELAEALRCIQKLEAKVKRLEGELASAVIDKKATEDRLDAIVEQRDVYRKLYHESHGRVDGSKFAGDILRKMYSSGR